MSWIDHLKNIGVFAFAGGVMILVYCVFTSYKPEAGPSWSCTRKGWYIERRFGSDVLVDGDEAKARELAGGSRIYLGEVCGYYGPPVSQEDK